MKVVFFCLLVKFILPRRLTWSNLSTLTFCRFLTSSREKTLILSTITLQLQIEIQIWEFHKSPLQEIYTKLHFLKKKSRNISSKWFCVGNVSLKNQRRWFFSLFHLFNFYSSLQINFTSEYFSTAFHLEQLFWMHVEKFSVSLAIWYEGQIYRYEWLFCLWNSRQPPTSATTSRTFLHQFATEQSTTLEDFSVTNWVMFLRTANL